MDRFSGGPHVNFPFFGCWRFVPLLAYSTAIAVSLYDKSLSVFLSPVNPVRVAPPTSVVVSLTRLSAPWSLSLSSSWLMVASTIPWVCVYGGVILEDLLFCLLKVSFLDFVVFSNLDVLWYFSLILIFNILKPLSFHFVTFGV